MNKRWISVGLLVVFIAVAAGLFIYMQNKLSGDTKTLQRSEQSLIDKEYLDSLDQESNSLISTTHLSRALTPPTNKWYSGMVLNKEPRPGFNIPNSILPRKDGFELGLPAITSTDQGVYGPHRGGLRVIAKDAIRYELTRYDELTITLSYYDDTGEKLFDVTFASGSPYGFVVAERDVEMRLSGDGTNTESGGLTTFNNSNAWYGAKTSNGSAGSTVELSKNDELAVFSTVSKTDMATLSELAKNRIIGGEVRYKIDDTQVNTTLLYETTNNQPTVLVRMPHHGSVANSLPFSYPSLYGDLAAYKSNAIKYEVPLQKLERSLELNDLAVDEESALAAQLRTDIADSKLDKVDTYFGGKQLQRLAQLVEVADSLGEVEQRDAALNKLTPAIEAWFDSNKTKSFYYDKTAKTIVGREASFGSDKELNDHHFHYGYFIYAASVATRFDTEFLDGYRDKINVLVADIANYNANEPLPLRRNFDEYAGHSWASGLADYVDGNNQESSSEAVNAWTGVGLWAEVTNNPALTKQAKWLLSNEIAAAKLYWLSQPSASNYSSPLVAINWGGKREYKTFFSDEANAKLAIQLLPLNPSMQTYIEKLPNKLFSNTNLEQTYGDYILMAQGATFSEASSFDASLIDDGNSKSYIMAYSLSSEQ
jgi:endo-1,3(4)-beta-glucanase